MYHLQPSKIILKRFVPHLAEPHNVTNFVKPQQRFQNAETRS